MVATHFTSALNGPVLDSCQHALIGNKRDLQTQNDQDHDLDGANLGADNGNVFGDDDRADQQYDEEDDGDHDDAMAMTTTNTATAMTTTTRTTMTTRKTKILILPSTTKFDKMPTNEAKQE